MQTAIAILALVIASVGATLIAVRRYGKQKEAEQAQRDAEKTIANLKEKMDDNVSKHDKIARRRIDTDDRKRVHDKYKRRADDVPDDTA